ncbi:MAG TPA: hypothetical protein VHX61_20785 [Rhizomicrobium sp.]|jgi:hypothetical protein|nr:hypothetical protein [Rhizomicrobium sp.]
MGRFPQSEGARGSLKWIQKAVNACPELLDKSVLQRIDLAKSITWLSPLAVDEFAEYRDDAFLDRIQCAQLNSALGEFWPARGPQWDALGRSDKGDVLLVEAKAHIDELCSPPTQASESSRVQIQAALAEAAQACHASPRTAWTDMFYQLANRIAHLYFLRREGVPAWLVLVNFVGGTEMNGPLSAREWIAAYQVAYHVMGLGERNPFSRFIMHLYPDVAELE